MRGFPRSFMAAQARYDSLTPSDYDEDYECPICLNDEDRIDGMQSAIEDACCLLEDLASAEDAPDAVRRAHKILVEVEI